MPIRTTPLVNGEYYHIFNRGVAQMPIFNNAFDFKRFIKTTLYYQLSGPKPRFSIFTPTTTKLNLNKKIVNIVCYCLMPNHFHFIVQQNEEGGVSEFISKLTNSYTKYINIKYNRTGHLFQGQFKAVHIETNEQFIHVSRYIHLNPLVGYITTDLTKYPWSSYLEYIGLLNTNICSKDIILGQFESREAYKQFVQDQKDYGKMLEIIKHQLLDDHSNV